jgi:hypothetical protein
MASWWKWEGALSLSSTWETKTGRSLSLYSTEEMDEIASDPSVSLLPEHFPMSSWYVSNISIIFYAACFTPFASCFVYTSWRFYAIFGTNLLTRCHSSSSLFSAVLCFGKATQEIFSELDETKAETPIFPGRRPNESRRGARGQPHHRVARATPWPRPLVVRWPW